jgi:hypothetical protein
MKTFLAFIVLAVGSAAFMWPKASAVVKAAQSNAAVQLVPPGQRHVGNPHERGTTYYGLEAQATRVTTRFRDGHVALSDRSLTGDVHTSLRDPNGNERAKLALNRVDAAHDTVSFEPADGTPFQAISDPAAVHPTLDWAARQAYGLAKDGTASLVWDNGVMRPKGASRRDVDVDVKELEITWANGVVAKLSRRNYPRRLLGPGRYVEGPAMVTELTENGVAAGAGVWFERDQVFAYQPAGGAGSFFVGPEHLKQDYGGWDLVPDTTWAAIQTIAQYHYASLAAKTNPTVAKSCGGSQQNRVAQFFFPTVSANENGCDNLHWLDGSILRICCDDHDRCYQKRGCGSSSWWRFWSSWQCDMCNMEVVQCFVSGVQTYCDMMRLSC